MQKSLNEIVQEVVSDPRVGVDGCSNIDRLNYVMEVMEIDHIDLNAKFDYSQITTCKDLETALAIKHLAVLQMTYLGHAFYHGFVTSEDYSLHSSVLVLAIQKINWHLEHLEKCQKTPPFPFIH